jgi:hypothetical protein
MDKGMRGVGAYWCIVEMLYEQNGIIRTHYDRIAFVLREDTDFVTSVINDYELFIVDAKGISSARVNVELRDREVKSKLAKTSIKSRWNKGYERNTNVIRTYNERNTNVILEEKSRVEKSREENKRGDNTHTLSPAATSFVKPTIEEVKAYCVERSNIVDADKWFDYYQSNGWRVGRNAMKDWRAAVRTWEKSSFEKKTPYQETVEAGKRYLAKVKQQEDYVKSTDIDPRVKSLISGF